MIAEFEIGTATEFGFKVRKSADDETVVGYDTVTMELFVDRTNSGLTNFHPDFAAKHQAPLRPIDNRVRMSIFMDWSSIEVFGGDGIAVISNTIFPASESNGLELFAVGGNVKLVSLQINELKSIWRDEVKEEAHAHRGN
ncbi:Levanase precursor [compost metagenome]